MDNLTKSYVYFFYQGLRVFYPTAVLGDKAGAKQSVPETWEGWKRSEFTQYILSETGTGDIDEAASVVFGWKEYVDTGKAVSTMPPLERIQEAAELQERIDKETNSFQKEQFKKQELLKSQRAYEELVSNAQKAREALKKEIHLEPKEKLAEVALSAKEQEDLALLTQAAVTSPEKFVEEVSAEIAARVPEEIKNSVSKELFDQTTKAAAINLLDRLASQETVAVNEAALLSLLAKSKNLERLISDPQLRQSFSVAANELLAAKAANLEQTKALLKIALNKNIVEHLFAGGKESSFQVVSAPTPFSITVSPAKILEDAEFLKNSSALASKSPDDFNNLIQKHRLEFFQRLRGSGVFSQVSQESVAGRLEASSFFVERQTGISTFLQSFHPADGFRPIFGLAFDRFKGWAQTKVVSQIGKTALGKALSGAIKKGVGAVTGKASGAGIGAALGSFLGPGVGNAIGAAVGWLTTEVGGKLLSRIGGWLKENKWVLFLPLVPLGLIFGTPLLALAGIAGASLAFAGGAVPLAGAVGGAFRFFFSALILPSIALPLLFSFLVVPVVVVLILFIINSGAYLVPPSEFSAISDNPYVAVEKTVSPEGLFQNTDLPITVTYEITVTAKKGSLGNISFDHECRVIREGSTTNCPAPLPGEVPQTISAADPFVYTYNQTFSGNQYRDSLILNTFSVTADTADSTSTSTSGAASLVVGNPPTGCFELVGDWPSNARSNVQAGISYLVSNHTTYVAKVCSAGAVQVVYDPTPRPNWGYAQFDKITLYSGGVGNTTNAAYIMAHEAGHLLSWRIPSLFQQYRDTTGLPSERPLCSYSATTDEYEAFAEAAALYGSPKTFSCMNSSFSGTYPNHYNFARDVQFR